MTRNNLIREQCNFSVEFGGAFKWSAPTVEAQSMSTSPARTAEFPMTIWWTTSHTRRWKGFSENSATSRWIMGKCSWRSPLWPASLRTPRLSCLPRLRRIQWATSPFPILRARENSLSCAPIWMSSRILRRISLHWPIHGSVSCCCLMMMRALPSTFSASAAYLEEDSSTSIFQANRLLMN